MLDNIRENSQGTIAKVILGFVVLTFAIAGVGSYTNSVDTSVAEVNGKKISKQDFDQAFQSQKQRMQKQFGQMYDVLSANPSYMANLRNNVVDQLIDKSLLDENANDLALRISNERLKDTIRNMPEFQVNGKFDNDRYLALINQAGFIQSSNFRDYLKVEMTRRQLSQGIMGSEFVLPYQTSMLNKLENQQRDIRYLLIKSSQFDDQIKLTDKEINDYYQAHTNAFETKEQVKLNYVALDIKNIQDDIAIPDSDVKKYYDDNIANYTQAEKRKVSHILIEFGKDKVASKAKAEALLKQLKNGADFAQLAKQNSDDTFSGKKGGDLDWVEKGVMDPAFESATYALKNIGDMTGIVTSSFGYHIIKLTDLKPKTIEPLAQVQAEIKTKLAHDKAQDKYYSLQQKLSQISFESPDSLDDAAKAINAKVQTTDWLSKSGNPAPFDNAKLMDAAFTDMVLKQNANSDLVNVNDGLAVVVHLNAHKPAKVKPLADVKAEIVKRLTAQKASSIALTKANDLIAKLTKGDDISADITQLSSKFIDVADITRNDRKIDQAIVKKAFVLPHPVKSKISAGSATLANGDFAIVQVTAVKDPTITANNNGLAEQQLSQISSANFQRYIDNLKAEATIKRKTIKAETN